jgi:dimethylhistidine N-methyltransferase
MRNESPTPLVTSAEEQDLLDAVLLGLRQHPKNIPPKFFYDARGSHLFDLICDTPEYYPTRTETRILEQFGAQMAELIGTSCVLIELGSGSATKTPLLLRQLNHHAEYVPIDISKSHLLESTQRLQAMFPAMQMRPLCADYTQLLSLPLDIRSDQRRVVFFPGSTIGNYTPDEAVQLLQHAAKLVGHNGALLIGVDCKKSPELLNAAYNDAQGYTAAFNGNLLLRMQRELGAQLDPNGFDHYAYYNAELGRIEMHLISQREQLIQLGNETFHFDQGESLHTENSYKYSEQEFQQLARAAGWHPKMSWTDRDGLFNVHYLSLSATEPRHLPQRGC